MCLFVLKISCSFGLPFEEFLNFTALVARAALIRLLFVCNL